MLKHVILSLFVSLCCAGCASHAEVGFEWFNLGTNEIWVTDVIGIPAEASPGRLIQNHAEDQLERSESVYSETVRLGDRITIKWKDNGKQGWPGGLGGLTSLGGPPPRDSTCGRTQARGLGYTAEAKQRKNPVHVLRRRKVACEVSQIKKARFPVRSFMKCPALKLPTDYFIFPPDHKQVC